MTLLAQLSGMTLHYNINDVGAQFVYVRSFYFEQDYLECWTGKVTFFFKLGISNLILYFCFSYSTVCKKLGEKGFFP